MDGRPNYVPQDGFGFYAVRTSGSDRYRVLIELRLDA